MLVSYHIRGWTHVAHHSVDNIIIGCINLEYVRDVKVQFCGTFDIDAPEYFLNVRVISIVCLLRKAESVYYLLMLLIRSRGRRWSCQRRTVHTLATSYPHSCVLPYFHIPPESPCVFYLQGIVYILVSHSGRPSCLLFVNPSQMCGHSRGNWISA